MDILKHIRGLFIIHVPRYAICKDKTVSSLKFFCTSSLEENVSAEIDIC